MLYKQSFSLLLEMYNPLPVALFKFVHPLIRRAYFQSFKRQAEVLLEARDDCKFCQKQELKAA